MSAADMFGYWTLLGALGVLAIMRSTLFRGEARAAAALSADVVLYIAFCLVVFVHLRRLFDILLGGGSANSLLTAPFQAALCLIAVGTFLQLFAVRLIDGIYYRMLTPSALNAAVCVAILPLVGFGTINIVWFFVLTGALAGYLLLASIFRSLTEVLDKVEGVTEPAMRKEILQLVREEMNRYFRLGAQAFLALGASLGVSMSILFRDGEAVWNDPAYRGNASVLVIAFGMVSLGLLIWLGKPYLDSFVRLRTFYDEVAVPTERIIRL